jgi:hypothetical protein
MGLSGLGRSPDYRPIAPHPDIDHIVERPASLRFEKCFAADKSSRSPKRKERTEVLGDDYPDETSVR